MNLCSLGRKAILNQIVKTKVQIDIKDFVIKNIL